ncbi:MAG TPA: hypothetical protein VGF58_11540 [Burkholderiales bacterium]
MVRALDALWPLRPFHALGPLGALVSLDPCDALGTVLAALHALETVLAAIGAVFHAVLSTILAAVFPPVLAAVGAQLVLSAQLDPQAIVVLAQPHPLEVELARELFDGLRDLLALLRLQAPLADAHFAHILIEQRLDLGDELLEVDRTGGIARHIEPDFFTLVFAAVFTPVFLAYV